MYSFGDGKCFPVTQNVDIPMGNRNVMLKTHIAATDVPLLLSRKTMKKADIALDFRNEDVIIFGEAVPLLVTKLHYALP